MAGGRPLIFPVNYVVDGKTIVFCTDEGAKRNGVTSGFNVALEIDGIEPLYPGWSVLVSGVGRHVINAAEVAALAELPPRPWAARERSPKSHFVRIRHDH